MELSVGECVINTIQDLHWKQEDRLIWEEKERDLKAQQRKEELKKGGKNKPQDKATEDLKKQLEQAKQNQSTSNKQDSQKEGGSDQLGEPPTCYSSANQLLRREVFKKFYSKNQFRLNETEDSVECLEALLLELHNHLYSIENNN